MSELTWDGESSANKEFERALAQEFARHPELQAVQWSTANVDRVIGDCRWRFKQWEMTPSNFISAAKILLQEGSLETKGD